ncbi:hypothetical protein PP175_21245 [Aneurinibacillus sp. Ricciae_BoGa-3]|uniref:hypothetical protein n=1 Tax=Aneurinibacillus sp. Ricciae_BoGa-3 TaxID=3022697 RepID=UPI00233FA15E|nr:hypothetical protein [Aneurinibacillus sp. Ricciae_BoGa-3]WCK53818.1 hypothetical protein PP175_21245 [Aneurinibacillus sp. Ricciae_BoGa-3]
MNGAIETNGKLYPPEYEEFAKLVKKHIVYTLVLRVLPSEIQTIGRAQTRLGKGYISILFSIQEPVLKELNATKKRLREIGGKIIEEKQEEYVRVVTSSLQGDTYTHRFGNYVLLSESEETVKSFIQGRQPSLA